MDAGKTAKIIVSFCAVAGMAAMALPAFAQTNYQLPDSCQSINFSRNLKIGDRGSDVKCLQIILNEQAATQITASGIGSPGNESNFYGNLTAAAVAKFQNEYAADVLAPLGLSHGTGFFGASTRLELLKLLVQTAVPSPSPTPTASSSDSHVQPAYPSISVQSQTAQTEAAIAKASSAVVSIIITKQVPQYQIGINQSGEPVEQQNGTVTQEIGAGTGFIITPDGYILTNKHVVFDDQATYTVELASGLQAVAAIVYKDPNNDFAILKIPSENYPVLPLGNSDSLVAGQPIIAIGNALGQYSNTVSLGIVSGLHRQITAYDNNGAAETLNDVIQTDAPINPGNSGGPLLDLSGNVVGINVAEVQGSNSISFALPINPIKSVVKTILPNENIQ